MHSKTVKTETPYQDALKLLNNHDGHRFEAVKSMISDMKLSDVRLITDFCLNIERSK